MYREGNASQWGMLDLEQKTEKWADKFGEIFVVCGPAFDKNREIKYIGDAGEMPVAVPHYFWKVVIRYDGNKLETLAFLYPHKELQKTNRKWDHSIYAVSIDKIESMTNLDILSNTNNDILESTVYSKIWSVR